MITLTDEQVQQIEEALKYARNICVGSNWSTGDIDLALAIIQVAKAQEQEKPLLVQAWEKRFTRQAKQIGMLQIDGLAMKPTDMEAIAKTWLATQVEREPVADIVYDEFGPRIVLRKNIKKLPDGTQLFTNPVRTKDLTDEEEDRQNTESEE